MLPIRRERGRQDSYFFWHILQMESGDVIIALDSTFSTSSDFSPVLDKFAMPMAVVIEGDKSVVSSFSCSGIPTGDLNPIYNVPMLGTHKTCQATRNHFPISLRHRPSDRMPAFGRSVIKHAARMAQIAVTASCRRHRFPHCSLPHGLPPRPIRSRPAMALTQTHKNTSFSR